MMKDRLFRLKTDNSRGVMIAILAILAFALSLVEVEAVTGPINGVTI